MIHKQKEPRSRPFLFGKGSFLREQAHDAVEQFVPVFFRHFLTFPGTVAALGEAAEQAGQVVQEAAALAGIALVTIFSALPRPAASAVNFIFFPLFLSILGFAVRLVLTF